MAVLLLLAGLIAIATAVITASTSQRRVAQRAEQAEVRNAMLDSALRVALVEIAFPKPEGPSWQPRQPRQVSVDGRLVDVSIERESGRVDLNTAEERYLLAAFAVSGQEDSQARTSVARIQDWVDADDSPRPRGAEREQYMAEGLAYAPRNGPFETVEEVRQVLGLHHLNDESLELFTVYSQQREPAPSEMTESTRRVWQLLARGAGEGSPFMNEAPRVLPSLGPGSHLGAAIRLSACVQNMVRHCRTAVVRFTGANDHPWQVLRWQ